MDVQRVSDELEITALLSRYARAVDTKDWALYITNIESEIDGDTALVRAMFYNPTQIQGIADLCFFGGYYHHELVRTPDGWRSPHLREEAVWSVNSPRGV